jgi:CheY-like chemotaxis protein
MTKIMLVEDDKSLREIYGVRLLAEGYDIVSAVDGEEALAMAIKERPSLIVADIMMPKISGFDMLDILRSTTETKNIKVIIMTALSSDDQRQRGEQLGADRYLVKSQVGIEDVVRVVHEVLGDKVTPTTAPSTGTPANAQPSAPATAIPTTYRAVPSLPVTQRPMASAPRPAPPASYRPISSPPSPAAPISQPVPAPTPAPTPQSNVPAAPSVRNRVIQPINDPAASKVDINELLDRELAKEAGIDVDKRPPIRTTEQEKALVDNQINRFSSAQPAATPTTPANNNTSTIQIDTQGRVSMPGQEPQPAVPSQPPTPPPPVQPAR